MWFHFWIFFNLFSKSRACIADVLVKFSQPISFCISPSSPFSIISSGACTSQKENKANRMVTLALGTKLNQCEWAVYPRLQEGASQTQVVRESKCFLWISCLEFVLSSSKQVPFRKKTTAMDGRPRTWTFLGQLVMQCFIMQKILPLVCLLAFERTSPAFLSINKANWPVLRRQVTSVTLACTEQLCESLCLISDNFIYNHGTTICHSIWRHCWYYKAEVCLGWKRSTCWSKNRSSA